MYILYCFYYSADVLPASMRKQLGMVKKCRMEYTVQGETIGKVEAHLVTKHRLRARARSIGLDDTFFLDAAEKVEVLFHRE